MWFPDSSGWVEMVPEDHGTTMYIYKMSSAKAAPDGRFKFARRPKLVGFLDDRHVLITEDGVSSWCQGLQSFKIEMYDLRARQNRTIPRSTHAFTFPNSFAYEYVLSPDSQRICWSVLTPFKISSPGPIPKTGVVASIWVTDQNGVVEKLAATKLPDASYSGDATPIPPAAYSIQLVTWSSDGSQIVYRAGGKQWVVDVPAVKAGVGESPQRSGANPSCIGSQSK
jgi:hypothetical protein